MHESAANTTKTNKAPRHGEQPENAQNQQIVLDFFAALEALDLELALSFIHEKCVYQNMPFHKADGKRRIRRDLTAGFKPLKRFQVDMLNIASHKGSVLTERVDTLGTRFFETEIPLMGILQVKDQQIIAWRDYFDWSAMMGKVSGSLLTRPFRKR